MAVVWQENARHGYLLDNGEGEAFWLLGMLEIVKISGASTNGEYGLVEVTVRAGEGPPWHVHPDEERVVLCPRGGVHRLRRRHAHVVAGRLVRVRPQRRAAHLHRRNARSQGADRLP